jgi:hypothetical protein
VALGKSWACFSTLKPSPSLLFLSKENPSHS